MKKFEKYTDKEFMEMMGINDSNSTFKTDETRDERFIIYSKSECDGIKMIMKLFDKYDVNDYRGMIFELVYSFIKNKVDFEASTFSRFFILQIILRNENIDTISKIHKMFFDDDFEKAYKLIKKGYPFRRCSLDFSWKLISNKKKEEDEK